MIPDNLRTGVTTNTRYDTIFNRSYAEMAEYYDTEIYPCRVDRPQDKSPVEGSVKYVSTWILAALRNQKFFTMQELSEAVSEKLEELNGYPFHKRVGNRNTAYLEEEMEFKKPLPITPFEPAVWSTAKVQNDYLISDGKNKYSVSFDLIGEQVDIRLTKGAVEVFFHGSRVASHPRLEKAQRDPVVLPKHMPPEHRKYLKYDADEFRSWASDIGPKTEAVIDSFLTSGKEPEQGYKYCVSLTKLSERYGKKRLEAACEHALCYTSSPTLRNITSILKNGQDKIPVNNQQKETVVSHGITRGASYYKRGGASNVE